MCNISLRYYLRNTVDLVELTREEFESNCNAFMLDKQEGDAIYDGISVELYDEYALVVTRQQ